jgi:hypothetical protein
MILIDIIYAKGRIAPPQNLVILTIAMRTINKYTIKNLAKIEEGRENIQA